MSRFKTMQKAMFQHHRCLLVFAAAAHGFLPPPNAKAHLQRRAVDDEVQVYDGVFAPRDLEALDVAPLRYLYKPLRSDAPDVAEVVAMARGG